MRGKICLALVLAVALLCTGCGLFNPVAGPSASPAALLLQEIDRYVTEPDVEAHITQQDRAFYRQLIDGVAGYEQEIKLSDSHEQNLYYLSMLQKSPFASLIKSTRFTKDKTSVKINYKYSESEHMQRIRVTEAELLRILRQIILPDMNETEKALAVYRYFSEMIRYDYQWRSQEGQFSDIDLYQALVSGKGVCHEYSYLCWYALAQLGMEAFCVTGVNASDGAGHMWLLVRIDGAFYHCDPTWESVAGGSGLGFFGMTDEERLASGIKASSFAAFHEPEYGEVVCTDGSFEALREVSSWSLSEGHILRAFDAAGQFAFDTVHKRVMEND